MKNEVRDMRRQGWMWADRSIIKEHGKELGPFGIAVYMALCAYAGPDQEAFPSYNTLAETIGCSRRKVIYVIGQLEKLGLITKGKRSQDGEHDVNVYTLLDTVKGSERRASHSASTTPGVVHDTTGASAQRTPEVKTTNYPQKNERGARKGKSSNESWSMPEEAYQTKDPVEVFNLTYASLPDEHPEKGHRLNLMQYPLVKSKVTDLDRWRDALETWTTSMYSPRNVRSLIDHYENIETKETEWKPTLNLPNRAHSSTAA